jgi:hypothetical protein
MRMI